MAEALSRVVSDADRSMISGIRHTQVAGIVEEQLELFGRAALDVGRERSEITREACGSCELHRFRRSFRSWSAVSYTFARPALISRSASRSPACQPSVHHQR